MRSKTRAQLDKIVSELTQATKEERVRKAIDLKSKVVEEIKNLRSRYKVLAIVSIDSVPSAESRRIYKKLSEYGVVKLYKNSLVLRALRDMKAKNLDEVSKYITGSNVFIFTNMNPFMLAKLLDELIEYRYAKPGDVANFDVELAPSPTGIKPGPSMSLFGKLKIPTQVREGVIWIAKDTKVLKQGDKVSPELSSLLRRLNIPIIPVRVQLKAVYEDGYVFLPRDLKIDYEEIRKNFMSAAVLSKLLAIELTLPIPDILPELILRARRTSVELAAAIGYTTPEIIQELIVKAVGQAFLVASAVSNRVDLGIPVNTVQERIEKVEERKEEMKEEEEGKEEVKEEDIAEGISSLFG